MAGPWGLWSMQFDWSESNICKGSRIQVWSYLDIAHIVVLLNFLQRQQKWCFQREKSNNDQEAIHNKEFVLKKTKLVLKS